MIVQFQCACIANSELVTCTVWGTTLPTREKCLCTISFAFSFTDSMYFWCYLGQHLFPPSSSVRLFHTFTVQSDWFGPPPTILLFLHLLFWIFSSDLYFSSLTHSSTGFTVLWKTFIGFLILIIIIFSYIFFHWFFLIVSSSLSKFLIMSINSLNMLNIFCVSWLYYLDPMWVYLHCLFSSSWSVILLPYFFFCLVDFFIEFQTLYLKKCQGKVRSKMVFLQREFISGSSRRLGPLGVLDYISIQRLR